MDKSTLPQLRPHRHSLRLCLGILLALCSLSAAATEPLVLSSGTEMYPLGLHLEFLEDPEGNLSLEQVRSSAYQTQFIKSEKAAPSMGFTPSVFWFRCRMINLSSPIHDWLLENQYPLIDDITLYKISQSGDVSVDRGGDTLPFDQRAVKHRNLNFEVSVSQGKTVELYLRIKTASSLQAPLVLWSKNKFIAHNHESQYVYGFFYGILVAIFIYNLLIFLSIREVDYFYYLVAISMYFMAQITLNGFAYEYLWPNSPRWGNLATPVFVSLSLVSLLLFSRPFLQLEKNLPRSVILFKGFTIAYAFLTLAALTLEYQLVMKMAAVLGFSSTALVFTVGFMCWIRGVKQARFFMLAWSFFMLGIILYALRALAIVPNNFITENGIQIGAVLEFLLLSFALSDRMKLVREENERIQNENKRDLEVRVRERTDSLNVTLKDLSTAHDKLKELNTLDGLTGARNRNYFLEQYDYEWKRACRAQSHLGIMMVDIDHFKRVNDTYGHLGGDETLKQVTQVLHKNLRRPGDVAARYGGEEFIVLLPNTDRNGALCVAERIRADIEALNIQHDKKLIRVTVSIGLDVIIPPTPTADNALIASADAALYVAKNSGRNQTQVGAQASG